MFGDPDACYFPAHARQRHFCSQGFGLPGNYYVYLKSGRAAEERPADGGIRIGWFGWMTDNGQILGRELAIDGAAGHAADE